MYNSGFRSKTRTPDGVGTVASQVSFVQKSDPTPSITGWSIQNSDDRALDPAGGQTVVVAGGGFISGMTVTIGTTAIGSVTIVSSTQATFTSPARAAGNYTLTMANSNGQAAILVPGLAYSTAVTWSTSAGNIGTTVETTSFTESVVATADSSITYALASGSLPTGATLNANGTITGTAVATASPTTYSFAIIATDAELQDSTQSFTITVNPDTVTWVSPTNGASYSLTGNQPMSNVTLSATAASGSGITYSANALPTGVSLTGNVIYGTPTVAQTVSTLLTATANTTSRSSTETITWTVSLGDIYWPYVSMLLNGSTPTTTFINDASLNNAQLTIAGDTKPNLFTPYSNGYYSNYFDGTGDYLTVPANASLGMGSGDFTVEFWLYQTSFSNYRQVLDVLDGNSAGRLILWVGSDGTIYNLGASGGARNQSASGAIVSNTWTHVVLTRISGTTKFFINGVQSGSNYTDSTNYTCTSGSVYIGCNSDGSTYAYAGNISNFRMVKGTAVYTTTFTPPTAPLTAVAGTSLLTCQSNRLIDNSVNNFTITKNGDTTVSSAIPFVASNTYATYGSAYFDGNGDSLTVPNSPAPAFGTGDFTVQFWVYPTVNARQDWFDCNTNTPRLLIYYDGTNIIYYSTSARITGGAIVLNSWQHIAVSRSSGSTKMFVNGVQVGSTFSDTINYTSSAIVLGRDSAGSTYVTGYMSDVQVIKGTGLYTSNFLPPQAPLTPVTNTQLLTCQYNGGANNNGFVDRSSFNNLITRAGNATQGTFSPYSATGWSSYLSSSTIAPTTNAAFTWGTEDYTIEMWYNPSTSYAAGNSYLFDQGSNNTRIQLYNNYVRFFYNNGATELTCTSAGLGLTVGTWYHLAIVRRSSVITMYINGTACGTVNSSANETSTSMNIGNYGGGGYGFNGYISNFRAVKGTAVYTTNFTPSTTPLSPVAGTSILTLQSPRFIDSSPNNFALTLSGSPSIQAYSPFGGVTSVPTSYSTLFTRANSDYLSAPASSAYAFGTGAYTIEAWVYFNSTDTYRTVFQFNSLGNGPVLTTLNSGAFRMWNGSNDYVDTSAGIITTKTWYHVAWVRESTSLLKLYLNGTLVSTVTSGVVVSTDLTGTPTLNLGYFASFGHYMDGYISNFRVTKGQALYTTAFTPSTTPLTTTSQGATAANVSLLTCQNNTMIDNSPNYFTITTSGSPKIYTANPFGMTNTSQVSYTPAVNGGSMYFDGSGDYVTAPNPTSWGTTTDFTIEHWFYPTSLGSAQTTVSNRSDTGTNYTAGQWYWYIGTDGTTYFYLYTVNGSSGGAGSGASVVKLNQWNHLTVCRKSGTLTMFMNGIKDPGTLTNNTTDFSLAATPIGIGKSLPSGDSIVGSTGYITDVKITKGVALYSSNFYPGAAPATPTQTIGASTYASSLLLNGTSGGIVDAHGSNNLETVGNTQLAPKSPYAGDTTGKSLYFDGTADRVLTEPSPLNSLGSGSFTIEGWLYCSTLPTNARVLSQGTYTTGEYLWIMYSNGGADFTEAATARLTFPSGSFTAGSWIYFAIVRSGSGSNNLKAYVNGVNVASATSTYNYSATTSTYIGSNPTTANQDFNGYIKDLRLTKGVARYTTTFTPPTTPDQTN